MFGDKMNQQEEVTISLECGHPNVEHGKQCPICNVWVMAVEKTDKSEGEKNERL